MQEKNWTKRYVNLDILSRRLRTQVKSLSSFTPSAPTLLSETYTICMMCRIKARKPPKKPSFLNEKDAGGKYFSVPLQPKECP